MKKILFSIVFLGLVSLGFAGNLITNTDVFEQKAEYASRTKDTLAASDSQTVYTKWTPGSNTGSFYYLVNNEITGTGSDSIRGFLYSDEYDYRDSLLGRILIDSLKTNLLSPMILPISNGLPGSKHTLKWITTTGSGAQIITNGWNIIKCKPIK
jgi:hypothetical protein